MISDEAYEGQVFTGHTGHIKLAQMEGMRERTVTLGTASKMFSLTGRNPRLPPIPAAALINRSNDRHLFGVLDEVKSKALHLSASTCPICRLAGGMDHRPGGPDQRRADRACLQHLLRPYPLPGGPRRFNSHALFCHLTAADPVEAGD